MIIKLKEKITDTFLTVGLIYVLVKKGSLCMIQIHILSYRTFLI